MRLTAAKLLAIGGVAEHVLIGAGGFLGVSWLVGMAGAAALLANIVVLFTDHKE